MDQLGAVEILRGAGCLRSAALRGAFSVDDKYFYNLTADQKKAILDYELFVYVCDGTDSEKLDWFRIINIAGEKLTDQELRNAVYAGSWTSDAKRYFSKTGCAASAMAGDYLKGASIRQEYLETAILWASSAESKSIEGDPDIAWVVPALPDAPHDALVHSHGDDDGQAHPDGEVLHPGGRPVGVVAAVLPEALYVAEHDEPAVSPTQGLFGEIGHVAHADVPFLRRVN